MSTVARPRIDPPSPEHDAAGALPGPGRHLLEASAGTGKTYALAALATRLVAERAVPVDQLLVVTFTRAAAAELRDRIRRRLVGAAGALAAPDPEDGDAVHRCLLDGSSAEVDERRRRLERAVADFDTATITTIHGFCQQVLQTLGATSGQNPDAVLVQDTDDLIHGACADVLTDASLGSAPVPIRGDSLVRSVTTVLNNPGVEVVAASGRPEDDLRRDLVVRAAREVRDRLGSTGTFSYDGMLEAVRDALAAHPAAAASVAEQFPVALVDEFQDTDPVQWAVLRTIYTLDRRPRPDTRLVLVGDPKQAIYAFRGGDIHTYLLAAAEASRSTLPINHRTDGALIDALNGICRDWRLGEDSIRYLQVRPAADNASRRMIDRRGAAGVALEVRCAASGLEMSKPTSAGKRSVKADPARWACIDDVVRCIVEMLSDGWRIPCDDVDSDAGESADVESAGVEPDGDPAAASGPPTRPLRAGDIAVLVHANRWAAPVQRALVRAGVPAIVTGASSVADSPAADQWRILLDALARPSDPTRARAVALSWLGDRDVTWVAASTRDDGDLRLAELQAQLDAWAQVLRSDGVAALLAALRVDVRLAATVLSAAGGERDLTDLEHLGELLHRATAGRPVGPESLRAVLDEMAAGGDEDDPEAIKRRIDTDAPAVRIMTLHAAKGLEFPVVCCPSLWNLSGRPGLDRRLFHTETGRCFDVSTSSADVTAEQKLAAKEIEGQDQRLTYVGMTRAVHRLVLWWAAGSSAGKSPIAPLLFGGDGPSIDPDDHARQIRGRLEDLGLAATTSVADVLPHGSGLPTFEAPTRSAVAESGSCTTTPGVARLGRRIDRTAGRWSFTAITSRVADHDLPPVSDAVVPAPVHGDPDDPTLGDRGDSDEQEPLPPVLFDGLGAGAAFGTLVHDVMEHLDFTGDLEEQLGAFLASRPWAGDAARRAGLTRAIAAAVRTPLGVPFGDLVLEALPPGDRLDELEFELPLVTAPGRRTVDTASIGQVLVDCCAADDPVLPWARRLAGGSVSVPVGGFLTGSIDLVLRTAADVPGGHRYSVVDYKTNRLGIWAEPDTIANYRPDRLAEAMAHHHYPLQAVLYSVALHRYLRWRLDGYDPSLHLGPVGYLFVRGMVGPATPNVDGRRHGVFDWSVPPEAVVALSDLLDGVGIGGDPIVEPAVGS